MPLPKKPLTHAPRWLVRFTSSRNDRDDPLDAVRVLALADEGRKLAAQLLHHPRVLPVGDARLALVDERVRCGGALEDILDLHP